MAGRVVVVGAGAVGGFFGGLLARAGEDVSFVARGATLEALRDQGLTVRSREVGEFVVRPSATDDPASLGRADLVLFCVKTYDFDEAVELVRPLVGAGTSVLPLQNGVDAAERLGRSLGREDVLVGVTYVRAYRSAPSVVEHDANRQIIVGEPGGGVSQRAEEVVDLLRGADIAAESHANVQVPMWVKFVGICGVALTAVTRLPFGPLLASSESRALLVDAMQEVAAVGRAQGVAIPEDAVDRLMGLLPNYPPTARSSMADDLEAGRRLELESLTGTVVRLGRESGVPTPVNRVMYAALKSYADGQPRMPRVAEAVGAA